MLVPRSRTTQRQGPYRDANTQRRDRPTGGSDFHGDKDEIIGYYKPDSPIPMELLQGVEERLAETTGRI